MTHADLTVLLDFHYWALHRVLDAVAQLTPEQYRRDLKGSFASVHDTLVHLYSAEWAWYTRWQGVSPLAPMNAADYPDLTSLRRAWSAHESQMREYLASLDEPAVARTFSYKTFDGRTFTSAFWEMLHHVVNHGTYHRGQVQTMLRQLGAAPSKSVDLITFYREKNARAMA